MNQMDRELQSAEFAVLQRHSCGIAGRAIWDGAPGRSNSFSDADPDASWRRSLRSASILDSASEPGRRQGAHMGPLAMRKSVPGAWQEPLCLSELEGGSSTILRWSPQPQQQQRQQPVMEKSDAEEVAVAFCSPSPHLGPSLDEEGPETFTQRASPNAARRRTCYPPGAAVVAAPPSSPIRASSGTACPEEQTSKSAPPPKLLLETVAPRCPPLDPRQEAPASCARSTRSARSVRCLLHPSFPLGSPVASGLAASANVGQLLGGSMPPIVRRTMEDSTADPGLGAVSLSQAAQDSEMRESGSTGGASAPPCLLEEQELHAVPSPPSAPKRQASTPRRHRKQLQHQPPRKGVSPVLRPSAAPCQGSGPGASCASLPESARFSSVRVWRT